jgi:deazaflavin-dependent oxidoreductase (nitroreductase family)
VKLPEPLFVIINPIMRLFLRSSIHGFMSGSMMLITFTGRKSGRQFTTPVRYIKVDETIRCFTSAENQWWRNLRSPAEVQLRVQGKTRRYTAKAVYEDAAEIKKWLMFYLDLFPQDAAYHNIGLNKDKSLVEADLLQAVEHAVVVEANPVSDTKESA